MVTLALAIQILPLLAFLIILLAGRRRPDRMPLVAIGAIATSLVLSIITFIRVLDGEVLDKTYKWIVSGSYSINVGLLVDPLTATMLVVVTSIATLVMIFSYGYMHGEERINWYFSIISLFSTSMLALLLSNNYLQMLISWELVGACSYFLIGFYYKTDDAANASKKAFIVTKIGDVGMILGILLIFVTFSTLHFGTVFTEAHALSKGLITTIAVLLFCGAVGKSAQFPLHVWLPDAMAGPTPVSALIHAATMVAAGVYLVARSMPLFEISGTALTVVAYTGAITALIAATIATAAVDIKKILAYSTISQLGYMFIGLGVGSISAGMFHLVTHAFFKALLFLGSGSIIHALHTQDIREMGGLLKKMKTTVITFIIGSLALSGIPPLAGFWSKDEILAEALHSHNEPIFIIGLIVAFLTAFYMARLCFMAFFGEAKKKGHESPAIMTVPLGVLAVAAIFAGFWNSPFSHFSFTAFLHPEAGEVHVDYMVMAASIIVAVSGIFVGYLVYMKNVLASVNLSAFAPLTTILVNKYYFDEIYHFIVVRPTIGISRGLKWFDVKIMDGIVNGVAWVQLKLSRAGLLMDLHIVDRIVNLTGAFFALLGARLRNIQSGQVQSYGLYMFAAIVILFLYISNRGGL